MANEKTENKEHIQLEKGTYEIIRDRLNQHGKDLRQRLEKLNTARKDVFGSVESQLIATERITTENNCIARDIVPLGKNHFIFGYNVHMGLKSETKVSDVFGIYLYENKDHAFRKTEDHLFQDKAFQQDFFNLYKFYRDTFFIKFAEIGTHIFMVFQIGKTPDDIKTFKWRKTNDGLVYVDNRSEHEFVYPNQHEFKWKRVNRDMHRKGMHPHISIDDRMFVETVSGDLTIKVEDNTDSGKGIYSEPVEDADQTLDDSEIYYAIIGNLIALKIRPYQEKKYRYIVYNEKIQKALRVDALEDSCVLLPDDHGIIFAKGYYIQTGEVKLFDNQMEDMLFDKRIASPNGEDFLYVFYQQKSGLYTLLSYNLIEQEVATPIICSGYSLFDDGELIYFKAEDEQKKHHSIQIWQTPFYSPNKQVEVENKSYLFKIGNKEIVRAMAESGELIKLINKEDNYNNLYIDLVKISTDILDAYHWLQHKEALQIKQPIQEIRKSAGTAIEEYEKVTRIKQNTREESGKVFTKTDDSISRAKRGTVKDINEYVERLASLRSAKGEILSLRELRYADQEKIEQYEANLQTVTDGVSKSTVDFLLKKEALQPYETKVDNLSKSIEKIKKVVEAKKLNEEILKVSGELEMLIEIVSNLKIEDATQTTRIIDNISGIYSQFNRIKAALQKKTKELIGKEGEAEFNAQLKLVNQGLVNYLDICDTPEKCEEYLNKLMVQLEELEGKFIGFEKFLSRITEKREEVYNAFESKKVYLTEAQNKRSLALYQSAERIISGIQKRLMSFKSIQEINSYYAADMMVDKVRDLARQLLEIGDSVKADDVESKLKSVYEESSRQLKDRQELFVDGENVIRFGKHSFNVNTQNIDLSLVNRDGEMFYHITGTNFFEKVTSEEFLATRDVWEQSLSSENNEVYRAEFLAYQLYSESLKKQSLEDPEIEEPEDLHQMTDKALQGYVQRRMSQRYDEGYIKGIHDRDGMLILKELLNLYHTTGLLRYTPDCRVLAYFYWEYLLDKETRKEWIREFEGIKSILKVFPNSTSFKSTLEDLTNAIKKACTVIDWANDFLIRDASRYLFHFLSGDMEDSFSQEAFDLAERFQQFLKKQRSVTDFDHSLRTSSPDKTERFHIIENWLHSYLSNNNSPDSEAYHLREAALLLLEGHHLKAVAHKLALHVEIEGLRGDHPRVDEGKLSLHFNRFMHRLKNFEAHEATKFQAYIDLKKKLLEEMRREMRLSEFQPRVLSSFVRNKLLNEVYLPLIGDNLAKQIGAAGDKKRTDLMGLLLLISPPGYGKTTLMEYISKRLGLVFMKINGPAIGHRVTALDPQSASNSAAREELEKLNLAFEMGDNVMIYLDDIQHCNPEFLQKFISLCDAQRKVEGVYKGVSKTYDFRGKKVAVVMAGNPYTESGDKFQIPDMLANRADIYNLGDIIGGKADAFEMSYLENSITSNSTVSVLNGKSQKDIRTFIRVAETGDQDNISFEHNYAVEDIDEYLGLFEKMIEVRDIILKVNKLYIYSAGQSPEFRTEPPFRLQGSYRNMNKIVEKLSPVMNAKELKTLLLSHYENESQTLTTGAEFNFLKFKELFEVLSEEEAERKAEIMETFQRNQKLQGLGGNKMGHVLEQMEIIARGLQDIGKAIWGVPVDPVKEIKGKKK